MSTIDDTRKRYVFVMYSRIMRLSKQEKQVFMVMYRLHRDNKKASSFRISKILNLDEKRVKKMIIKINKWKNQSSS